MEPFLEALDWYLAPWRKIGRGTFNVVVGVASLITPLLGLMGFVGSVGSVLGPFGSLLDGGKSLEAAMNGTPPPDVQALEQALHHVQTAGEGFSAAAGPAAAGINWAGGLDILIWVALIPLVLMRLRDMGKRGNALYALAGAVYAGMVMGSVSTLVGRDVFGWWGTAASVVSFGVLAWLCVAPSRATGVTTGPVSKKVNLDEQDPYPPFRP
ncbi:MAG: hypothetical protein WAZ18_06690 [Alphaproteobacteria bacterium]